MEPYEVKSGLPNTSTAIDPSDSQTRDNDKIL